MSSGNLSWIGNKWGTLDKSSEWVKLKIPQLLVYKDGQSDFKACKNEITHWVNLLETGFRACSVALYLFRLSLTQFVEFVFKEDLKNIFILV